MMAGFSIAIFMSILFSLYLFFMAAMIVILLCLFINYVFESFSIMAMDQEGVVAWIPFYHKYLLGKLANSRTIGTVLMVSTFLSLALGIYFYIHQELEMFLFAIFIMSVMVTFILDTIIAFKIYKKCTQRYCDLLTILTILSLGMLRPLFLFILRNRLTHYY